MQVKREEVVPARLPAQLERHVGNTLVGDRRVEPVQAAQPLDIGHGLDVEGEDGNHQPGKTPVDR